MKTVSLSGSLRENVGKKDAKALRNQGLIPCVIYGGEKQIHFAVEVRAFDKLIFTPNVYFIEVDVDGEKHQVLLKDVQYHPVNDSVLHVDFYEFHNDQPISIAVPIKISGVSPGIIKGGALVKKMRKLTVKALPAQVPDYINIDISSLEIGDGVKVKNIEVENVVLLDIPDLPVVNVVTTRAAAAAAAAATADGK